MRWSLIFGNLQTMCARSRYESFSVSICLSLHCTSAAMRVDSVLACMGDALDAAEELRRVQEVLGEIPRNDLRIPYERISF